MSKQKAVPMHERGSSSSPTKETAKYVEEYDGGSSPAALDYGLSSMSAEERRIKEKKLIRRLDFKLIPWLCLLYLTSFLDRTNIGNAKINGLLKDLHLTNGTYNAALSVFFVSYALFEPLTNVLLKAWSPRIFLTVTIVLWGLCMTFMGFCTSFAGLAAARFFLGVAEAGLFPGVNYYLSCWYKREEFGIRAAIFFSAAALAGSFGGLLAAAIAKMNGVAGKHGWSWIFILEGLVTVLIGFASYWMVHDFPDEAKFLTEEERALVISRLKADNQASAEKENFQMKYFWAAMLDWKTWMYMIIYMGADGPLYAFSLFLPTIIADLGYTATKANLLTVPPYAVAAVMTISIGYIADRTKQRGLCNIFCSFLGMTGFIMLIASQSPHVKYAGVFLGAAGIYPCIPNSIVWASNNFEGVYKRGVMMGFVIGWGNLNGVMSSNIYRLKDKPKYTLGHAIVLAYMVLFLFGGSVVLRFMLARENKKRKNGERDSWGAGMSQQEKVHDLGDQRGDFIYTL